MSIKEELKLELEKKLEKMVHIFIMAQEAYFYAEYFYNPDTREEASLFSNSCHRHSLGMIRHLIFRSLVVEVSKLFSSSINEKFTLQKLLSSLSKSGRYRQIEIPEERLKKWKCLLCANQETINHIRTLRNKLYAHTDDPLKDYRHVDITFSKIRTLLDIASEVINHLLSIDIYDTSYSLDSPTFNRERFSILKLLAEAEKERQLKIGNRTKSMLGRRQ